MRSLFLILSILVAAVSGCDSPNPLANGYTTTRLTIEGSDFTVRSNGEVAEAIRTNFAPRKDFTRILLRAVVAIETATSCTVDQDTVRGDPALIAARIDCP